MKCGEKAEDGNRTRVASLEDWSSTIELLPQAAFAMIPYIRADVNIFQNRERQRPVFPVFGLERMCRRYHAVLQNSLNCKCNFYRQEK